MKKALAMGEAAEFLGVHRDTVKKWEREGRLPCFRTPAGHRRFLLEDLIRFRGEIAPEPAGKVVERITVQELDDLTANLRELVRVADKVLASVKEGL